MSSRPEKLAPPEIFYNDVEAKKYSTSSRMIEIQAKLTARALELLALPEDGVPRLLLDIGCGSGLSGESITEHGHHWVGLDIAQAMLDVATSREAEGDLLLADIGQGLGFRPGTLDGAISISAVQWLCNADKTCNEPRTRLRLFFQTLYRCLSRGAKAVLQVYPDGPKQLEMMTTAAMRCGFAGGLVVDYPHSTRAKKYFLVLSAGVATASASASASALPRARGMGDRMDADGSGEEGSSGEGEGEGDDSSADERMTVAFSERSRRSGPAHGTNKSTRKNGKLGALGVKKDRRWLLKKKDQRRRKGFSVAADTKYTGRKRGPKF